MAFIDQEAAKKWPERCPARVGQGWRSKLCGKLVKREVDGVGLCGSHAAGALRAKANDERRRQQFEEREKSWAEDRRNSERLKELGVRYWDKAEVIRVLESIKTDAH